MRMNKRLLMAILFECLISFMISMTAVFAEEEISLTGAIEITDSDMIIHTEEGEYLLLGEDLSHHAGKKMTVTGGIITERRGLQVVRVDLYEIIEDE